MPIGKQARIWKLVPCSKRAPKRTAQLLRHEKDCHEEGGVCSWAKHIVIITAEMPNMKRCLSVQVVGIN